MRAFKGLFIAGLLTVFLTACGQADTNTSNDPTMMQSGANSLKVTDQPAGTPVVSTANLEEPGFVVLHADNDNKPGTILGSSALLSGANENIAVSVATEAGQSYWAMLHGDNGDGQFSAADDAPIKDAQGSILMIKFTAQ